MKKSLSVLLLVLSFSRLALADKEASVVIYNEGKREYNLGNFAKAISHFEAAYREHEAPAYLYNIAQAFRQLKNCQEALFFYDRFLAEAPQSKQAPVIRGYLAELNAECGTPATIVEATPSQPEQLPPEVQQHELAAQKFFASGQFREAARAYEAAFQATQDSKYLYLQAEALRLGKLTVEAIGAYDVYLQFAPHGMHASLAHKRKSELEAAAAVTPPPSQTEQPSSWSGRKSLALGLGAVGLVGLGVGGVFGLQAMGSRDDALDPSIGGCGEDFSLCNATGVARYEDAQGSARNSNIAFGVGLAASAAALTLWLTSPSPKRESAASLGLSPALQRGAVGVVLSGEY